MAQEIWVITFVYVLIDNTMYIIINKFIYTLYMYMYITHSLMRDVYIFNEFWLTYRFHYFGDYNTIEHVAANFKALKTCIINNANLQMFIHIASL